MIRERLLGILVGAAMLLAACGGGGPPTAAPGQTAGSETTAGETTSEETTAETTDGETSEETAAGGGGGTADACALVTIDEVAAATGYGNIEAQPILHEDTMGLSGCGFVSDGLISAAIITILDPENTNTDPTGYLAFPGAEEVPVSGARAIWMPGAGYVMMVIKDGRVASVQATPKEGEFGDAARKLAQPVADRL